MTIKEVEALTGITKANIRFYEKEGLLSPGRSSNNYREYSVQEVEHLRKIRMLRIMGFSVAQIGELMEHPQRSASLMGERAEQIQKEVQELERISRLCLEVKDMGWQFDSLDPELLGMKLEWKKKGWDIMKRDRIDWLCRARDMAFLFCFLCIISMIMFPVNQILGVELPEKVTEVWRLIITVSPFPALILGAVTAKKARWPVPKLNRILQDSGRLLVKREQSREKMYERIEGLNQIALTSLLMLPVNKALGIRLPWWVLGIWMAVVAGLTIAVMVIRNKD